MTNLLSAPYPYISSPFEHWRKAFFMSTFVFIFLLGFKPFGLDDYHGGIVELTLGYGLTCFISMSFLNIAFPAVFNNYFSEEKWTVGKQIMWSIVNVAVIGLANLLYSKYIGIANFSLQSLISFEIYTVALAIFPLLLFIITNYKRLSSKFEKSAVSINHSIDQLQHFIKPNKTDTITIDSDNISEGLSIPLDDLVFIQSSDNYITVHYLQGDKLQAKVLRNTLKSLEIELKQFPHLFRCHKSFLVDLNKVDHISGNAQGYKLHLKQVNELIPVSRSHNKTIKNKLTIRP